MSLGWRRQNRAHSFPGRDHAEERTPPVEAGCSPIRAS